MEKQELELKTKFNIFVLSEHYVKNYWTLCRRKGRW